MFFLISAASHVYAFNTAVKHGKNPNLLLGGYLIAGCLLYLVGCLRESVVLQKCVEIATPAANQYALNFSDEYHRTSFGEYDLYGPV